VTSTVAGLANTTIYYKDAVLNVCRTNCGSKQYINQTSPNKCGNCSTTCTQCSFNSSYCQKCATGYFLHIGTSQCLLTCPKSFYNNITLNITLDTFICSPCASECKICTGPTTNACSACTNVTTNLGVVSYYFKQPNANTCSSTCPAGYLADIVTNNCEACQNGCISCSGTAKNCSACTIYLGVAYYLDKTTNTCATICPNGGSGNQTDFICYSCQYYTYNDKCLQSCPTGYIGVISNISTCVECSSTDDTCNKVLGFTVATKLVN
jgi:proprotein convertase subtilisin/kexin type 5